MLFSRSLLLPIITYYAFCKIVKMYNYSKIVCKIKIYNTSTYVIGYYLVITHFVDLPLFIIRYSDSILFCLYLRGG